MKERIAGTHMRKERITQSLTLGSSFHQAGDINYI